MRQQIVATRHSQEEKRSVRSIYDVRSVDKIYLWEVLDTITTRESGKGASIVGVEKRMAKAVAAGHEVVGLREFSQRLQVPLWGVLNSIERGAFDDFLIVDAGRLPKIDMTEFRHRAAARPAHKGKKH